ncbi:MAG TPA: hypothetical protein VM536_16185 [Chloroflexia bacterium]|nr:hypothetical protein [Chloroflexia bacterium]
MALLHRRPGYRSAILSPGLLWAEAYGLDRVLITCDATNTASHKIIEHNGVQLEDARTEPGRAGPTRRYWINL